MERIIKKVRENENIKDIEEYYYFSQEYQDRLDEFKNTTETKIVNNLPQIGEQTLWETMC